MLTAQARIRADLVTAEYYTEGATGSAALGTDGGHSDLFKINASAAAGALISGSAQLTIDPSTNGNVTVAPNGSGSTVIANGDLTLSGSSKANINMPNTATGSGLGIIKFGGNRFISNYGNQNTFVGSASGNTTVSAGNNSAFGNNAGNALTSGGSNVLLGSSAGQFITGGTGNIAVGEGALGTFTTGSAGSGSNIAIGNSALAGLTTGTHNTVVATTGAGNMLTGSYNTIMGYSGTNGGGSLLTGAESSNLLLGSQGVTGESNALRIGTSGSGTGQQNTCYIAGTYGVTPGAGGTQMMVMDTAGQMGTQAIPPSITWQTVAVGPVSVSAGNGYIAVGGSPITFTLPNTAAVGDSFVITTNNANGWILAQNANQTVVISTNTTTSGVGGSLASTVQGDTIYVTASTNSPNGAFIVTSFIGNITVV